MADSSRVCEEVSNTHDKWSEFLKEWGTAKEKVKEIHTANCQAIKKELDAATEGAETLTKRAEENVKEQLDEISKMEVEAKKMLEEGEAIKKTYETETVRKFHGKLDELGVKFQKYNELLEKVSACPPKTEALKFVPSPNTFEFGTLVSVPAPTSEVPFPGVKQQPEVKTSEPEVTSDGVVRVSRGRKRRSQDMLSSKSKSEPGSGQGAATAQEGAAPSTSACVCV